MSAQPMAASAPPVSTRERRRVAIATTIGTTIEWYDFFIYANAAGLVFAQIYFEPAGDQIALLLSFGSIGVSFLFRPLGAFIAGHLGDRVGRKAMLVATLVLMGGATTLIGLLPTYAMVGVAAPIILIVLRIAQGLSAGGEWGGAALMAVEFAPVDRRGRYGAFPQIGTPIGLILASGVLAIMGIVAPGDAFLDWGWRVPFLLSIVLIAVGFVVRRTVDESPVSRDLAKTAPRSRVPIVTLFRHHWLLVLLAALTFSANNAAGYMTAGGFIQNYATNPDGPIGLERTPVLFAVTVSAVFWLASTWAGGVLSDRIGRKRTYLIGWALLAAAIFPLFLLLDTGSIWFLLLGVCLFASSLGFTYGPQSAFFAELFPASIRYTGVAMSYAIGAILGGAFAPTIATALVQSTGSILWVGVYLLTLTGISCGATLLLRDRSRIPLDAEHEELQARQPIHGMR